MKWATERVEADNLAGVSVAYPSFFLPFHSFGGKKRLIILKNNQGKSNASRR
jgi:hypothetical protein